MQLITCALVRGIAAVLLLLHSPVMYATQHACKPTTVFYVNGVFNMQATDAYESALAIRQALSDHGVADAGSLRVKTVWNPGSVRGDLIEVAIDQSILPNWIGGSTRPYPSNEAWSEVVKAHLVQDDTNFERRKIVDRIKEELIRVIREDKTPVVAIAHSQGNIYLNDAVAELQSDAATKNVPGVRSIGVLGLGVAATPASIHKLRPEFHAYVTAEGDRIIDTLLRLAGGLVPSANFRQVEWDARLVSFDASLWSMVKHLFDTRHTISETYLSPASGVNSLGQRIAFSHEATSRFKELRTRVESSWPCIQDVSLPSTVRQFTDAELAVRISARPGDNRSPQGSVKFTFKDKFGGGDEFFEFFGGGCNAAPIDLNGYARCVPNFRMLPGTYTVHVNPVLREPFKWSSGLDDEIGVISVLGAGMLGDTLTFARRYPTPQTPFLPWNHTVSTKVAQGTSDEFNWSGILSVNPEESTIEFTNLVWSGWGNGAVVNGVVVFDGIVVSGFSAPIDSVSVNNQMGGVVSVSHTGSEVLILNPAVTPLPPVAAAASAAR